MPGWKKAAEVGANIFEHMSPEDAKQLRENFANFDPEHPISQHEMIFVGAERSRNITFGGEIRHCLTTMERYRALSESGATLPLRSEPKTRSNGFRRHSGRARPNTGSLSNHSRRSSINSDLQERLSSVTRITKNTSRGRGNRKRGGSVRTCSKVWTKIRSI